MLRKFTASVLICLMMAVTATSQTGLRYCLCFQTIFVGDCDCEKQIPSDRCAGVSPETSCCCACSEEDHPEEEVAEISLCNNCTVNLTLQLDHFTTAVHSEIMGKLSPATSSFPSPLYQIEIPTSIRHCSTYRTRGPPPYTVVSLVPLFIRHSVFLV
ncbi:MAG: hypothetical protein ACJAVK_000161 [Akkermansiaceae bacterium]|jgi:hypothetical protein